MQNVIFDAKAQGLVLFEEPFLFYINETLFGRGSPLTVAGQRWIFTIFPT